jgi:mRNA interferase RelE/StbE
VRRYVVQVDRKAEKDLEGIRDRRLLTDLRSAIRGLAEDPRPHGVKKLQGSKDRWRVRVGDWRIVYRIEDNRLVVLVVAVAKRDEVYR